MLSAVSKRRQATFALSACRWRDAFVTICRVGDSGRCWANRSRCCNLIQPYHRGYCDGTGCTGGFSWQGDQFSIQRNRAAWPVVGRNRAVGRHRDGAAWTAVIRIGSVAGRRHVGLRVVLRRLGLRLVRVVFRRNLGGQKRGAGSGNPIVTVIGVGTVAGVIGLGVTTIIGSVSIIRSIAAVIRSYP